MNVERVNDQIISRPASVAGFDGVGCVVLSADPRFSKGRTVRLDFADQAICGIHSCQHRRGPRARKYANVHSVSSHRARVTEGARNPSYADRECRLERWQGDRLAHRTMRGAWKDDSISHSLSAATGCDVTMLLLFATRHSPFAGER